MILGVDTLVGSDNSFYRQIVNGPFDADKLDYLPRDGYFTGLQTVVDVDRLLHTVTVVQKGGSSEIGVTVTGASILEQVLFAKTQLFTTLYHHHKVRAAHQMLLRLFRAMLAHSCKPRNRELTDPVSYIVLDDYDLLSSHGDPGVDTIVQNIKARLLPKRALVITYPCFKDAESRENFDNLTDADIQSIVRQVAAEVRVPQDEIMFDIPEPARLFGTGQTPVELTPGGETIPLQKLYPIGSWAAAYAGYRRVAYVFTTATDRRRIGVAMMSALEHRDEPILLNGHALALAKC